MSQQAYEPRRPAVLFVTGSMNTGGAETHVLTMASSLMQEGCFVAVASSGGIFVEELKKRGILHITVPLNTRLPHRILHAARIIRRAVKRYGFDILHAHTRPAALACRCVARGGILSTGSCKRVRFVTTAHLDFGVTPLIRRFTDWGERTLAVSEDLREYLIREYGLRYEAIDLTVNGIDTDRFYKKELPSAYRQAKEEPVEIVHVSRIDKDRALTAFLLVSLMPALLKEHNVRLTIVGGGELFKALSERVARFTSVYGERIILVGETADVLPHLRKADIAVGVSRAALEAMACSLPTILSGNDGYLGIFQKEQLTVAKESNFCCRGRNLPTEESLLHDLRALLGMTPAEREALGRDSRKTVEENYSLKISTNDYLRFYEGLRPYRRKRYNPALILGYHGFGNVGDDALLDSMIQGIRKNQPDCGITVLSRDPKSTERAYPVSAISRRAPFSVLHAILSAEILYVGGGTVLQSNSSHRSLKYYLFLIRLAKLFGKTIVYYGNGIGKLTRGEEKKVARVMATQSVISLRDGHSFVKVASMLGELPEPKKLFWKDSKKTRLLKESADCAILTEPCSDYHRRTLLKGSDRRYFVVAPSGIVSDRHRKLYEKRMANAILIAAEKGYFPVFLAMQKKKDLALSEKLASRLSAAGYRSLVLTPTPKETVGILSKAEFLLSSRLHPLVFAAAQGIPSLSYARDQKVLRFASHVFGKEAAVRFDKQEDHRLNEAILSVLIVKTIPEKALFLPASDVVNEMRSRARTLPDEIDEALITLSLTKKKALGLLKAKARKKPE